MVKFLEERNARRGMSMYQAGHTATMPILPMDEVKPTKLKPWVKTALMSVVIAPTLAMALYFVDHNKLELEEHVEWVVVQVPDGGGYDAAIYAAYSKLDEYDVNMVDIRDLRRLAVKRNHDRKLYKGSVIEVPVYTGDKRYK